MTQVAPVIQLSSVAINGDAVSVDRLVVHDAESAAYLSTQPADEWAATCERALKVGLVALSQAGVTINVDYMQRELERVVARMDDTSETAADALATSLRETFGDETGRLPQTMERYFGDRGTLNRLMKDVFDPERRDSAIGRIRALLGDYFDGDSARLATLLNPEREGSPLHGFRTEVREALASIAERMTAAEAARTARSDERSRSAAKGGDFETVVFETLAALARPLGDVVEDTSTSIGDSVRGKKGDLLLHVNPAHTGGVQARVAIELKSGSLGWPKVTAELAGARANRSASVALAVFAPGCAPAGAAPLQLHGEDIVCEFDPESGDTLALETAVRLARSLAQHAGANQVNEIDIAMVRARIDGMRNALNRVRGMKASLTSMTKTAGDVAESLDDLRRDMLDGISGIETELAAS